MFAGVGGRPCVLWRPAAVSTVTTRRIIRLTLFLVLGAILALVLRDVLGLTASETGVVSPRGYVGISHGSHTHYVPNGWDGTPSISDFPTSPPPEGMTVSETGQVVPAE